MCGICGYKLNRDFKEEKILENLIKEIENRGPDNTNIYENKNIGLGITRLAIRDINLGNQPFVNKDLDLICVFNGEIYNYEYLKNKIEEKGYRFKTKCDTELINPGFHYFGYSFFQMINGMFGIAIYNTKLKKLILIRDRFGIKPLYFSVLNDNFYFSSSAKSLFNLSFFKKKIDRTSMNSILKNRYSKNNHIFHNIDELTPGNFIIIDKNNNVEQKKYCEKINNENIKFNNLENKLVKFFDQSIKNYEQSDVPLSIMLSSGIDSRILFEKLNKNITPFTLRFKNSQFDESEKVKEICKQRGIDLNICDFNFKILNDNYDDTINCFDKPICDSVIFPTFYLNKKISSNFKVSFSGEGADEIFGGYYYFNLAKQINYINKFKVLSIAKNLIKFSNLKILNSLFGYQGNLGKFGKDRLLKFFDKDTKNINNFFNLISVFDDDEIINMTNEKIIKDEISEDLNIKTLINDNIDNWLVKYNLYKIDQMSMYNGLEVRVPYLDNLFYEIINHIKKRSIIKLYNNKKVLKKYFKKHIENVKVDKTALQNYYSKSQISNFIDLIEKKLNKNSFIFEFIKFNNYNNFLEGFKNNPELLLDKKISSILILNSWLEKNG